MSAHTHASPSVIVIQNLRRENETLQTRIQALERQIEGAKVAPEAIPLHRKHLLTAALLIEGRDNKQIAALLNTSKQMIKNRLRDVYALARVHSRLEFAVWVEARPGVKLFLEQTLRSHQACH